ncbi:hypothetical protein QN409_25040, partial [Pseudomonas sp. MH9.3]|nr:hypothetical protein [Pseudomonas sp. MH9.3]
FAARVILPDDPLDPSPPNRIVLILTVTQKTEYGESTRTLRLPAVRDNNLGGETIAIANDIITSLTDATIRIAFEWQTADGTLLNRSGSTVVRVVGTAQWSALPHPVLNGAASVGQQTAVDPLAIENYTSVTVKYPGMLATDSITLIWMYQDGTQYQTTLGGQTSGSVIFDLTSAQVVHKSVNSKVQLSYSIVRGGKTIASVVQTVTVATIVPGKLPSPLINGLTSGSTLFWKAFYSREVAVAKWPLIKAGQKVWLTITAAGIELKVLEGYSVNADEARNGLVDKVVLRDRIAALPEGSRVEVKCSVAFDEGGDPTRAVLFPIMTYMMEPKFNPPVITHAIVASSGRVLPNGGRLNLASEGTGVNFYWTCDARPYARYMYVKDSNIGGYSFLVPANVTSWSAWTGFHVPNVTTFIYVQESYDLNARSNLFSWTKT